MYSIDFFATRTDLEPGFSAIEKQQPVKLVRLGEFCQTKTIPVIEPVSSISNLGKISDRRSPEFLVLPKNERPKASRVVQVGKAQNLSQKIAMALAMIKIRPPGGKVVYDINQSKNPSSIVFAPGGFWNGRTLIAGKIATIHNTPAAIGLYRLFCAELLRGFSTVKSFQLGPEAMSLLKSGGRLTIDVQAAPVLDLILD